MKIYKRTEDSEKLLLREQVHQARLDVEQARSAFDLALDQELVEACIFELNAAKLRYSNLLKRLRLLEQTGAAESIS